MSLPTWPRHEFGVRRLGAVPTAREEVASLSGGFHADCCSQNCRRQLAGKSSRWIVRTACARSLRSPAAGRTRSPMAAPRRVSFRVMPSTSGLRGEIRHIAGVPATTATEASFLLHDLGLKRVTAISPRRSRRCSRAPLFRRRRDRDCCRRVSRHRRRLSPLRALMLFWTWHSAPGTRDPTGLSPRVSISARIPLLRQWRSGSASRSSLRPRQCSGICCVSPASSPGLRKHRTSHLEQYSSFA